MTTLSPRTCLETACGRRAEQRGYCKTHYMARWTAGEFHPERATCAFEGCGRSVYGRKALCKKHDQFKQRTGRVNVATRLPQRPGEEWRAVEGYEGYYEVSNQGRVRGLPREIMVKGRPHRLPGRERVVHLRKDGYPQVVLTRDNKKRPFKVHVLVAAAFIGPRPEGYDVNHRNADRADNRAGNLEYVTRSENNLHAMKLGRMSIPGLKGEQHPHAKLTADSVRYIRAMKGVKTNRELAAEFGVSQAVIWRAQAGETWKSVR